MPLTGLSYRKGKNLPARLGYLGHVLMENRNGLVVDTRLTPASGKAERAAAVAMIGARPGNQRVTVGADKAYDTAEFVDTLCGAMTMTRSWEQSARNRPPGPPEGCESGCTGVRSTLSDTIGNDF